MVTHEPAVFTDKHNGEFSSSWVTAKRSGPVVLRRIIRSRDTLHLCESSGFLYTKQQASETTCSNNYIAEFVMFNIVRN